MKDKLTDAELVQLQLAMFRYMNTSHDKVFGGNLDSPKYQMFTDVIHDIPETPILVFDSRGLMPYEVMDAFQPFFAGGHHVLSTRFQFRPMREVLLDDSFIKLKWSALIRGKSNNDINNYGFILCENEEGNLNNLNGYIKGHETTSECDSILLNELRLITVENIYEALKERIGIERNAPNPESPLFSLSAAVMNYYGDKRPMFTIKDTDTPVNLMIMALHTSFHEEGGIITFKQNRFGENTEAYNHIMISIYDDIEELYKQLTVQDDIRFMKGNEVIENAFRMTTDFHINMRLAITMGDVEDLRELIYSRKVE